MKESIGVYKADEDRVSSRMRTYSDQLKGVELVCRGGDEGKVIFDLIYPNKDVLDIVESLIFGNIPHCYLGKFSKNNGSEL